MDSERGLILAAEKAIADLQVQVDSTKAAAVQAKIDAASVARSARNWKYLTAALLVLVILTGYLWLQQRNATRQLRQQAVSACEIGNDRARGTVAALDELVTLSLASNPPTAQVRKIAAGYEAFVQAHNPVRTCP